jgi:hypothetical protein
VRGYNFAVLTCFYGVDRDNCTLYCDRSVGESYWTRDGHAVFLCSPTSSDRICFQFSSPQCVLGALCQGVMAADFKTCLFFLI